jgi:hypothetical protein
MPQHDNYRRGGQNSFGSANRDFRSPLESVGSMLPSKACGEAHHAEVVECALCTRLNSLKSRMGQNVKSPFSNIRAETFKLCSRSSQLGVANRPTFNSRLVANSP